MMRGPSSTLLAAALCATIAGAPAANADSIDGPTGTPRKTLPRLRSADQSEEISAKILQSTRGKPGPVRMIVATGDKQLAVLVAPDEVCDGLGLSLRPGEEVTLAGRVVTTGERPLMVTEAVVADGKRIAVRSPDGGWVKVPGAAQEETAPTEPVDEGAKEDEGSEAKGSDAQAEDSEAQDPEPNPQADDPPAEEAPKPT